MRIINPGLSFVIPAYNEENAIIDTAQRVRDILAQIDIPSEIIVVNDGSSDATRERALSVSGIRVISHPVNTGYGSALKSGIICARYEWIGIVDADNTYDCELIPKLVEKMKDGFDMVVAARENILEMDKPLKRFFRMVLRKVLNLLVNKRIEDPNSGLRIFRRDMALGFFPFLCDTFSFTTSITIFALGEGCFVSYVPMRFSKREGESKVRLMRDSLRMMQLIVQGVTFFNPVKLSIILALAIALFGFIPSLILSSFGMETAASYYLAVVIASGIMFILGIIADIIRLTATSRVHKPDKIVREEDILLEMTDQSPANKNEI